VSGLCGLFGCVGWSPSSVIHSREFDGDAFAAVLVPGAMITAWVLRKPVQS